MSKEHMKSRRGYYSGRQRETARRDISVPRKTASPHQNGSAEPLRDPSFDSQILPPGRVYRIQLSPGVEFDLPLEDQS